VSEAARPLFGGAPKPLTKTDLAYDQIRQAILVGHFKPVSTLDQEVLAEQLDLSTTPVREALRRLESERLVVRRAHRDTVVAPLSHEMLEETFTIRLALDPMAASLAATNATAEERAVLGELLHGRDPGPKPADRVSAHRQLHRAIYGACHNAVLVEMLDSLWNIVDRYRLVTLEHGVTAPPIHRDHDALAEAVIAGRSKEAAKLMREHTIEGIQAIRESAG
jgi:DNA-binding GntR family transcriptional regulator